jgi:2'-5' RNA ligase
MRIFIALDIPGEIRARIMEYMDHARGLAPEARWARPEGLHVTLKFVGQASDAKVQEIKTALAGVKATPFEMNFANAGFFPSPKSSRVFWIGVQADEALPRLASAIDQELKKLGIPCEEKAYHPHLTLARAGSGAGGHHQLKPLAPLLQVKTPPQFGTMTAREFFLYQSEPQRGGSRYIKLQRFALHASC